VQFKQEGWQAGQVVPERYFPGEHVRQVEALDMQVWHEGSQGRQLLPLRKKPGLQVIGRHSVRTSCFPTGQEVQADGPAAEQVAQEESQMLQLDPVRYFPGEQDVQVVIEPEQPWQSELQGTQTFATMVCVEEQVGRGEQDSPVRKWVGIQDKQLETVGEQVAHGDVQFWQAFDIKTWVEEQVGIRLHDDPERK
jgi:hypothetical protein